MRLAKKSALYFVSDVAISIIGFVAVLYFARVLGAGILGEYFLAVALLSWITIPSNGIASAINKRVSEGKEENLMLSSGLTLNILYGTLVSITIIIGEELVNSYVGGDVGFYLPALILLHIAFTSTVEGLKGQKKIVQGGFLRTFDRVIRSSSQVLLIYVGYELVALVGGHTLGLLIATVIGATVYGFKPTLPDSTSVRNLLSYSRYSWVGKMKGRTFGWMDTLVLGIFVSSNLVGIYEISWRLASVLILVSNAVEHTLFPEISDVSSGGDVEEVHNLLNEALFFAGIFVIPGFFGTLVLGPRILRIYGTEFVKGVPILLVLILARTVNVYEMQLLNVINGIDRPDVAFRINLVFIIANTVLNFGLIYLFDWLGAAVATLLSSFVILVLSYISVIRLIGRPRVPVAGVLKQVFSGSVMYVFLFVSVKLAPFWNIYITVTGVFVGAFVYSVVLYAISERVRDKTHSLIPINSVQL